MPKEKLRPTYTFTEDRLAELRAVVPEAFEDGSINWDTLRDLLAPHLADESPDVEHFGLSWPGKREARRLAAKPSGNTLRPAPGEGVNEDTTHNLYLEGDNLEVLKLLQKSYAERVKIIYIDPPYNTGNDFVYKDNFIEPSEDYLRRTGQIGERGELLTTNTKSDGRYHSTWLSMIYPRLRLGRTLLRNDGIIFISIGEDELQHLIDMTDEIFGEENHLGTISRTTKRGGNAGEFFSPSVDYVVCYAKSVKTATPFRLAARSDIVESYNLSDSVGAYKWRCWYDASLDLERSRNARYAIVAPDGSEVWPPLGKRWRNVETSFLEKMAKDEIEFRASGGQFLAENGRSSPWSIFYKIRPTSLLESGTVPDNIIDDCLNALGTNSLNSLGIEFSFSKPPQLIKRLITFAILADKSNDKNEVIVLDFFSGSATTAQSVLELNQEDAIARKFILIQLPEAANDKTPEGAAALKAGYRTIAEIGKERIRRVINQMKPKPSLNMHVTPKDLGFKVFTLGPSNFRAWHDYTGDSVSDLQQQFDLYEELPLADGWTPDDLLTEVLLLEGFPLDSTVTPQSEWTQNAVSCIKSPACAHRLWTCFDETLHIETVNGLTLSTEDVFICRDSALDDNTKLRLSQTGTLKTI